MFHDFSRCYPELLRLIVFHVSRDAKSYGKILLASKLFSSTLTLQDCEDIKNGLCITVDVAIDGGREKYGILPNGWRHGPYKSYKADGILVSEGCYKDNFRQGIWYTHNYIVGVKIKLNFLNDELHGMSKTWWMNTGRLMKERRFKHGKKDGLLRSWFENNQLFEEGFYENGEKNGMWREYNSNGLLQTEVCYDNGKPHGVEKIYDASGRLLTELELNGYAKYIKY